MKKLITAAALVLLGMTGAAQAAIVSFSTPYKVSFADNSVNGAIGLNTNDLFNIDVVFDDANIVGNQVTIDALSLTDSLTINFGNYTFDASDDFYGAPVVSLFSPVGQMSGLLFETTLTIGSGTGAGSYLLSFFGDQFTLTPDGDTFDFKATGVSAVPLPAALPLLLSGLGLFGFLGRRRKQA